jgi:hypothetical protein
MTDISHWDVFTVGTGLGNAQFTNRHASEEKAKEETVTPGHPPITSRAFWYVFRVALVWRKANGAILNIPISFDLSKALRVNVNVGAQYNENPQSWFATAGAGYPGTSSSNGASSRKRDRRSRPDEPPLQSGIR